MRLKDACFFLPGTFSTRQVEWITPLIESFLYRNALKDYLRPRKLIITLLLMLLPLPLALIQRGQAERIEPAIIYGQLVEGWVAKFILIILCVIYGTGIIANEVEQKTILYLLTRPVARWRILFAKYLAACTAAFIAVGGAILVTAIATYGGKIGSVPLLRDGAVMGVGVLVYTALFLLLGTILNRPLIVGLLFGFAWESWVPNMPGSFHKFSLISYLRALTPHSAFQGDNIDVTQALSDVSSAVNDTISKGMAWSVLLIALALFLGLALTIFSTREYVPRDDVD